MDFTNFKQNKKEYWYNFGYEQAGILYLGFVAWIKWVAEAENINDLYFMSRDGWIMKKLFNLMYEDSPIDTHYMYASRRMENFASMTNLGAAEIDFLVSGRKRLTFNGYFQRIDITESVTKKTFIELDIVGTDIVDNSEAYSKLVEAFHRLSMEILDKAKSEKRHLERYLNSINFFEKNTKAVVDIGWNGSMQFALNNLDHLQQGELWGLYFGTFASKYGHQLNMKSFILEKGAPLKHFELIMKCVEFFEFLFSAPSPSVLSVQEVNGSFKFVFAADDNDLYKIEAMTETHRGAIQYIKDNRKKYLDASKYNFYIDDIYDIIYKLLYTPTKEDVTNFGPLRHAEGFGEGTDTSPLINMRNLNYYVSDMTRIITDYKTSYWRTGFTKYLDLLQKGDIHD